MRWLALSAFLLLAAPAAAASVHQEALLANPYDPATMEIPLRPAPLSPRREPGRALNRIVYGYLPYWTAATAVIHWELLSHLAYFSVDLTATGTLGATGKARLDGTRYRALREDAATHGVKLTITFTNFDGAQIAALVGSKKAAALDTVVDTVKTYGAQGANIDFEFVPTASKNAFTAFMDELTQRLHAEVPGSHVTSATPGSNAAAYDFDQLLLKSDGMMVMFYGCHWGGSTYAGPLAPLTSGAVWNSCNMQNVVGQYLQYGGVENRRGIIWGLPFYGRQWPTASVDNFPSAVSGSGSAVVWTACKSRYTSSGRRWDGDSQTPWTGYHVSGQPWQLWCDDGESLGAKLDYLVSRDLGGLGIWALGYEGDSDDYWSQIEAYLTEVAPDPPKNHAPIAHAGRAQQGDVGDAMGLDGSASADPDGDPLTFAWQQVAGPSVALSNPTVAQPHFVADSSAIYRFWLVVSDGQLSSSPAEAEVTIGDAALEHEDPGSGQRDGTPTNPGPDVTSPVDPAAGPQPLGPEGRARSRGCDGGGSAAAAPIALLSVFLRGLRRRNRVA